MPTIKHQCLSSYMERVHASSSKISPPCELCAIYGAVSATMIGCHRQAGMNSALHERVRVNVRVCVRVCDTCKQQPQLWAGLASSNLGWSMYCNQQRRFLAGKCGSPAAGGAWVHQPLEHICRRDHLQRSTYNLAMLLQGGHYQPVLVIPTHCWVAQLIVMQHHALSIPRIPGQVSHTALTATTWGLALGSTT